MNKILGIILTNILMLSISVSTLNFTFEGIVKDLKILDTFNLALGGSGNKINYSSYYNSRIHSSNNLSFKLPKSKIIDDITQAGNPITDFLGLFEPVQYAYGGFFSNVILDYTYFLALFSMLFVAIFLFMVNIQKIIDLKQSE